RRYTRRQRFARHLLEEPFVTEILLKIIRRYCKNIAVALRNLQRNFSGKPADSAFELTDSRFARVAADYGRQRLVSDLKLFFAKPRLFDLPRNEIAPGDMKLLFFAIAGERNYLHTVSERRRYGSQRIRGRYKEYFRQIERQIQIMIPEREVLRG